MAPAVDVQGLNHWTNKEVPGPFLLPYLVYSLVPDI